MGLEVVTYISDLVATNPVGAVDPKSQGDDHIRAIKAGLLATFPALTGAVLASHTELNLVDGITGYSGTGTVIAKTAGPTFTGTVGAAAITASGTVAANLFSGSGASLTAIPAAGLAAGGTFPAINGSALTNLNGTNIASGTVADARLSANVAKLDTAQTFTANNVFTAAIGNGSLNGVRLDSASPGLMFRETDQTTDEKGWLFAANGKTLQIYTVDDAGSYVASGFSFNRGTGGAITSFTISPPINSPNADAAEAGYKGLPVASTTSGPIALADSGKTVMMAGNLTIPTDASVAFPIGTVLRLVNNTAGTLTVAAVTPGTTTLRWTGTGGTDGTRTLASHQGAATIEKCAANFWIIQGDLS